MTKDFEDHEIKRIKKLSDELFHTAFKFMKKNLKEKEPMHEVINMFMSAFYSSFRNYMLFIMQQDIVAHENFINLFDEIMLVITKNSAMKTVKRIN